MMEVLRRVLALIISRISRFVCGLFSPQFGIKTKQEYLGGELTRILRKMIQYPARHSADVIATEGSAWLE